MNIASTCIDTGNPSSPYDNEPDPNGGRINLGAYGNTQWAALTDITIPYFVSSNPSDGSILNNLSDVTITLGDNAGVDEENSSISITYNGLDFYDYTRDNSTDNEVKINFTNTAEDGTYTITATPVDIHEYTGSPTDITITLDSEVPLLTLNPVITPTNEDAQDISGAVEEEIPVYIELNYVPAGEAAYPTVTTWEYKLSGLIEGENRITVTAEDEAENLAAETATIILDTSPPAAVTDLNYTDAALGYAIFTWTATGDDGNTGNAKEYDIRYSTQPITDAVWNNLVRIQTNITPGAPGHKEKYTATDIIDETDITYWFAVRIIDDAGNISDLSNEVDVFIPSSAAPPEDGGGDSGDGGGSGCFIMSVRD